MVGESQYAYNGDFHPLRTAPYVIYTGVGLHWLSAGNLGAVGSLNVLIVLSLFAAAAAMYAALSRLRPTEPWTALVLSVAFVSSPAILALLYSGDMVASWTTLPFLPLIFYSLVRIWEAPDPIRPLVLLACALAMTWLAHAPIAFWTSVIVAVSLATWVGSDPVAKPAEGFVTDRGRSAPRASLLVSRRAARLWVASGAVGLCALLAAYVFVSVQTLHLPIDTNLVQFFRNGGVVPILEHGWKGILRPMEPTGSDLLRNLQLSPALWLATLSGLAALRARRSQVLPLFLCFAAFLLLLVPVLPVAALAWKSFPETILGVTEKWPMQRFYPILSALVPFLAILGLARHPSLVSRLTFVVLTAAAAASLYDARKLIARGKLVTATAEMTALRMRPENISLSRYSYEYFGRLPNNFTNGVVSPQLHTRLLGKDTLESMDLNGSVVREPGSRVVIERTRHRFEPTDSGFRLEPALKLQPGRFYYLRFAFSALRAEGTLLLKGSTIYREYSLPSSGEPLAFGMAPERRQGFSLFSTGDRPDDVDVRFIPTPGTPPLRQLADVEFVEIDPSRLPIRLTGLSPFQVSVNAPQEGWLETPKILIPGYAATVDGAPVDIARSPDGLVMVPTPKGAHQIQLRYDGPLLLRVAFWGSLACWVTLGGYLALRALRICRASVLLTPNERLLGVSKTDALQSKLIPLFGQFTAAGALAVLAFAALAALSNRVNPLELPDSPPPILEAELMLPPAQHGKWERLWNFNHSGQRWNVAIYYENGQHLRLALLRGDKFVRVSGSIPVNYLLAHDLIARIEHRNPGEQFSLAINQQLVLTQPLDMTNAPADAITLTRGAKPPSPFSGRLLRTSYAKPAR